MDFKGKVDDLMKIGYRRAVARARIAHDVILEAIKAAGFKDRVTIKGGVVMSGLTRAARRATMDMDVDFVRYSLRADAIARFIRVLNKASAARIELSGDIVELRQQEYRGKRLHLAITDEHGYRVMTKMDLGVHSRLEVAQKSLAFELITDGKTVRLQANSKEQMFVEKLRCFLRLGTLSSRYKDVFDMYYLLPMLNRRVLRRYMGIYIYRDRTMRERTALAVRERLSAVFQDKTFARNLMNKKFAWLDVDPKEAVDGILSFVADV